MTDEFHTTLAVQSAELDATHAENARLLTTADQTLLDHQKQLVELQQELAPKVKQYEADIQQLITDNEVKSMNKKLNYRVLLLKVNMLWQLKIISHNDRASQHVQPGVSCVFKFAG